MEKQRPQDIRNAQWNKEKEKRHQDNLSEFTGFYRGNYFESHSKGRSVEEPREEVTIYERSPWGSRPCKRIHN